MKKLLLSAIVALSLAASLAGPTFASITFECYKGNSEPKANGACGNGNDSGYVNPAGHQPPGWN